jgi:hypothetical protein
MSVSIRIIIMRREVKPKGIHETSVGPKVIIALAIREIKRHGSRALHGHERL